MKKIFYIAAAILVTFCSCSSDSDDVKSNVQKFVASIDDETETRAVLNSAKTKAKWESGDQIVICGKNEVLFKAEAAGTSNVTFSPVTENARAISWTEGDYKFRAFYPAAVKDFVPQAYQYDGKFNVPMVGIVNASDDTNALSFRYMTAFAKVTVSADMDLKAIKLTADKQICGPCKVSNVCYVSFYPADATNDAYKTVTLQFDPIVSTSGKEFYIPFVAATSGTVFNELTVTLVKSDDSEEVYKKSTTTSVSRRDVITINL